MHILSIDHALPPHRYAQREVTRAFREHLCPDDRVVGERLEAFHLAAGVGHRHLVLPLEEYPGLRDFKRRNDVYIEAGLELGERAVRRALDRAGLEPRDVDAIFVTTVTGIAVPTLDARLFDRLGFRSDLKRFPLFGLGCVAGAAGIARMQDYLRAWPGQVAVLLAVELCTLTLQHEDLSIPNLIGSGLFGDGAAAVVGVGVAHPSAGAARARVVASRSRFYPESQDAMGWDVSASGFRLLLSASVPRLIRRHLRHDVDSFLEAQGLDPGEVGAWILHPGGPKILEEAEKALALKRDALAASWRVLRQVGNLSSATILFVLEEVLAETSAGRPAGSPPRHGLMLAMGPGFCAELVLLSC